jgi:uncharacterized RDD family membrane protein YckC
VTEERLEQRWPGERLGLPESGPGSVAGWGRRVLALVIDWFLSLMASAALVGGSVWSAGGTAQWAPLAVFGVERWVLTGLLGASAGQLIVGIRIHALDGRPVGLWRALIRSVLLCLVIPPVIYNGNYQGVHDMAVGTVPVRVRS